MALNRATSAGAKMSTRPTVALFACAPWLSPNAAAVFAPLNAWPPRSRGTTVISARTAPNGTKTASR